MSPLKQRVIDLGRQLQQKRADLVQQRTAELSRLDAQLLAIQTLVRDWDTLTADSVVPLLGDAGLKVEIR